MNCQNEVDFVANKAREAWRNLNWKTWSLKKRLEWLRALDRIIRDRKEDILAVVAGEKSESEHNVMMNEYVPVRMALRYYANKAKQILSDENLSRPLSISFGHKRVVRKREPLGVVGVISPSNYPFSLPLGPVLSALLAGNAVVLKPARDRLRTNELLNRLLKESLAPYLQTELFEVLPQLPGYGEALVRSPHVAKIHFTGSDESGAGVARVNTEVRFAPPVLELGGSNAAIILEDADLDLAADVIVWARFCGLSCNAVKRVFAVAEVHEKLYGKILARVSSLSPREKPGFPFQEKQNFDCFLNDYAYRAGFGSIPAMVFSAQPVVLKVMEYNPEMLVLRNETFCPILPVVKVKDADEAIRCANDSRFGLGASVFTGSKAKFREIAPRLDCGTVLLNDALTEFAQPQVPFGGRKSSGWGFTHGREGLLEFTQSKVVVEESYKIPRALRVQLYPWTEKKMRFLRKFVDLIISKS